MDILRKKEFVAVLIGFIVVVGLSWWGVTDSKQQNMLVIDGPEDAKIRIYYGKECPHCERLFEYMGENNIDSRIPVARQEVWHNKANQKDMLSKAKECGIPDQKIGVPLLYSEGKCYIGEDEAKQFFSEMLK